MKTKKDLNLARILLSQSSSEHGDDFDLDLIRLKEPLYLMVDTGGYILARGKPRAEGVEILPLSE
jgi:hypothetical protein